MLLVDFQVALQLIRPAKGLGTARVAACVGLLARVGADVAVQVFGAEEGPPTPRHLAQVGTGPVAQAGSAGAAGG